MKQTVLVGMLLFSFCPLVAASDLRPFLPGMMIRHDVNKTEVIMYEAGISTTTAISCQQYMRKTFLSTGGTEIYKMPETKNAYLVFASSSTEKDWIVVLKETEKTIQEASQRLEVDGSWNPSPHFYARSASVLIIAEISSEEFGYYQVLEYKEPKLVHLGDIKIDQYINGKPLTQMGDLLEGDDVNHIDDKYEIILNSLVKKGWAPSASAVTFRFPQH